MQLNRNLLMAETTLKYSGKSYSSAKVALAYDCISIAQEWFDNPTGYPVVDGAPRHYLKQDLRRYVNNRVKINKYRNSGFLFISSVIWWFIARAVISWIIDRIIDNYL